MKTLTQTVFEIFEKIEKITSPESVEVLAATKTRPLEAVLEVVENTPIKIAGENRVQEFLSKYDERVTWDFIGQLQTNKVKYIIDKVWLIHSVERDKNMKVINKEAYKIGKIQDILIQINAGEEEAKAGIYCNEAKEFAEIVKTYKNIKLKGLMAVVPLDANQKELTKLFEKTKKVYDDIKSDNNDIKYLSMGMSGDYELAIKCGANLVRLGRAIFGERK